MNIRPTNTNDIAKLQQILDETGLFPSDMLPEMLSGFLTGDACDTVWLTCENNNSPAGFCYAAPEKLTEGTWNMLAIAVSPDQQGAGVGAALTQALEDRLLSSNQRILIADTSGLPEFQRTRNFYLKTGYTQAARIPDFWDEGDDKVTFWKKISG